MSTTYADVDEMLVQYLTGAVPSVRFCTSTPAALETKLPVVRVQRIGGGDSSRTVDAPAVDVDCFAADEHSANVLAGQVRAALMAAAGYTSLGATVASVGVRSFGWRPYANTNVRSTGMSVDLELHNHT